MELDFQQASRFCIWAHDGQLRKYSGDKYHLHPHRVAASTFLYWNASLLWAVVALLHDTVEDQPNRVSFELICMLFGDEVARMVCDMTNEHSEERQQLPREERKRLDRERLARVPRDVKLLKMLDRQDNIRELTWDLHKGQIPDPGFCLLYCTESRQLVDVLKDADLKLSTKLLSDISFLEAQATKAAATK